MGGDAEKVYLESGNNKKTVYILTVLSICLCIVLGVLYGLCESSDKAPCTLCYNEGTLIQGNNTCTCVEGYGGECCDCEIQDCEVTPWSVWSACTQVCGPQGTRFRNRSVAHPACGGAPCFRIPVLFEEEACNRKCYNNGTLDDGNSCTCPDGYSGHCCGCKVQDCVMTPWSNWSACSHPCGPHGMAKRTRDVQTASMCGGEECSGVLIQQKPCNRICDNDGILDNDAGECKCPDGFSGQCCRCENVDCELSNWTDWSTCDNSTRQERSRHVKRYPKCAGNACDGSLTEDRPCEVTQLKEELLLYKRMAWSLLGISIIICLVLLVVGICVFIRRRGTSSKSEECKHEN